METEAAVEGLKRGCRDSWELLYRRFREDLVRLANSVLRDSAEAEDVAQQIFQRLPRTIQQFDSERGDFKTWLLKSASNLARTRMEGARRRRELDWVHGKLWLQSRDSRDKLTRRVLDATSADIRGVVVDYLAGEEPRQLKKRYPHKRYFKAMARLKKELAR